MYQQPGQPMPSDGVEGAFVMKLDDKSKPDSVYAYIELSIPGSQYPFRCSTRQADVVAVLRQAMVQGSPVNALYQLEHKPDGKKLKWLVSATLAHQGPVPEVAHAYDNLVQGGMAPQVQQQWGQQAHAQQAPQQSFGAAPQAQVPVQAAAPAPTPVQAPPSGQAAAPETIRDERISRQWSFNAACQLLGGLCGGMALEEIADMTAELAAMLRARAGV